MHDGPEAFILPAEIARFFRKPALAGVEFTNGDQPGVRLRKSAPAHSGQVACEPEPTQVGKSVRGKTSGAGEPRNRRKPGSSTSTRSRVAKRRRGERSAKA
jgi:hypothetical protein